jgi:hypothetical protein
MNRTPTIKECEQTATGDFVPVEWLNNARLAQQALSKLLWTEVNLPKKLERQIMETMRLLGEATETVKTDPFGQI